MEKLQILLSVFLTLWKCEALTMKNVTFYNITKSWKGAADFCLHKGGVLESNVTLLKEEIYALKGEGKIQIEDVWFGKYRLLTNWTFIRGCFLINGVFQHFVIEHSRTADLQCQLLCDKYTFYSLKGTDCYCIGDIDSFVRRKNCNCIGCYKVWEHLHPDYGTADKNDTCIAAKQCLNKNQLQRSYEKCNQNFDATCDNDAEIGYGYGNYQAAAEECERLDSFLKWHSDDVCVTKGSMTQPHWTSGTRKIETFLLRKANFTEHLQPEKCFKLDNDHLEKMADNCTEKISFFCRFGTDEDKGDMKSIPQQQKFHSDDSGSIAAGIVTSIIALIVVISVLVFINRRRLSRKKPTVHESQNNSRLQDTVGVPSNYETSKAPIYNEIDAYNIGPQNAKLNCSPGVNNITYDQVNSNKTPKSQNVNQSANSSILTNLNSIDMIELQIKGGQNEYEMAKVINVTGNSSEVANSSNYCLAKPITSTTEEESDPYDINKDYDHVNNVKKKEDPITKVYDHLPTTVTDDPTYDHSNFKSASDNGDYYDHFKNDGDHD